MGGKAEKGSRKLTVDRETMLALLLGFIVGAYLKADVTLYTTFAAALVAKTGVFNWGNAQEHKAAAEVPKDKQPGQA